MLAKAELSIVTPVSGITTFVSDVHPENAPAPIVVIEFGSVIDSSDVHPENALLSIVVIEFGSTTDTRLGQFARKLLGIVVMIESGSKTMDSRYNSPAITAEE